MVEKGDYLYEVYPARTCHLLKVEDVRSEAFEGKVYNLQVMQDESYVIHKGPAVHCCCCIPSLRLYVSTGAERADEEMHRDRLERSL